MQVKLTDAKRLGTVVRAVRKTQQLRQDDTADLIGVSENFLGKVERGRETVQWGKLFQVLQGLGIQVVLDLPAVTREDETALAMELRKQDSL